MSTETDILDLSDYLLGNVDRGKYTVAIFLDLNKAFDTLNKSILNRNLRCYDVSGKALEDIVSCFSQRSYFLIC